jgi:glycosyltransferase involved in cell wall biosynthesis
MKIAVDAYYLGAKMRGMARYAEMLLQSLPGENKIVLPLVPENIPPAPANRDTKWFPLWEQVILPVQARKAKADFLLCPYNTGPILRSSPPVIVVIHDLIFLDDQLGSSPSRVQNLGRMYRKAVVGRIAHQSYHVITCSHYSKRQIEKLFRVASEKITVIPNIVSEDWFQNQPDPDRGSPYVLAVAGEAPSKNAQRLLEAMAILHAKKPSLTLKLAGVSSNFHASFTEAAARLGIGKQVELVPYLTDAELRSLYRRASAFVCPSLAEGFGIPLLEAMAAGVPVSSSHATSLPEVAGDCAVYFDPYDPQMMASAIEASLDESSSQERAAAGRQRARQFTLKSLHNRITDFWLSFDPNSKELITQRADCA